MQVILDSWTLLPARVQPLYGLGRKESSGTGLVRSSIGQLHLISDKGDPVQDCRIDRFVRLVGMVISFTIPH